MEATHSRRLLIIEDNETLAFGLSLNLQREGFEVEVCRSGTAGLASLGRELPDLVLLDLLLPDMPGMEVLHEIRGSGYTGPIVILSALAEERDRVLAFRCGASDYVTKPFGLIELIERVKVRLRESHVGNVADKTLLVNESTGRVYVGHAEIHLTPKEFRMLSVLLRSKGHICSKAELLRDAWGVTAQINSRTVDQHFRQLRKKLLNYGYEGQLRVVPKRGFILE